MMQIHLAPMEGVLDHVFRHLLTQLGGIDQCTTEFIRVTQTELPDHVFYRSCPELYHQGTTPSGTPVFVQLLGSHPELMGLNAQKAVKLGALGIDLNFGCPAKTVNRHDGGATLLKDPRRLYAVISAVRRAVPPNTPVTAKVRLGFENKDLCIEIAQAVAQGGATAITIHARTRTELYRPPAHWEFIAKMREAIPIPVFANGDIWTLEDFHRCQAISGCHSFALGRPLVASPDLALQIKAFSAKAHYHSLSWQEISTRWLPLFVQINQREYGDSFTLCRTKQWLRQLARTYPEAQDLFQKIKSATGQLPSALLHHSQLH